MTPQDRIKVIEEGRKSPFWKLIEKEMQDGLQELKEELLSCPLAEVKEVRAKIQVLSLMLSTPDMVIATADAEKAIKEAEEKEQEGAERVLYQG